MKKHFKLLTIILAAIVCLYSFTAVVWAVDADGDGYDDETGEYIGGDTPVNTDPVIDDPDPFYTDPVIDNPDPEYTEPGYVEPEPYYTDPIYDPTPNNGNSYYYEEPSYLGGGQSYIPPESTAPSVPLINTDKDIDVNELSGKDWNDIAAKLKNTSSADSDGDDFSFIQKNTSTTDNGDWMLILGICMIVLSMALVAYLIVSSVSMRKKLAYGGSASGGNSGYRYRSNNDYDDGYSSSKAQKKAKNKSRKFDTADVDIPKGKGGRRYK